MYPEIGFIGEEDGKNVGAGSECVWILDPIDGTTNYIYGYNLSAISLALKCRGKLVFGAVYNPFANEMFRAVRGEGAFLNDVKIRVSKTEKLENALVAAGCLILEEAGGVVWSTEGEALNYKEVTGVIGCCNHGICEEVLGVLKIN